MSRPRSFWEPAFWSPALGFPPKGAETTEARIRRETGRILTAFGVGAALVIAAGIAQGYLDTEADPDGDRRGQVALALRAIADRLRGAR